MFHSYIDPKEVESGLLSWGPLEESEITCNDGSLVFYNGDKSGVLST